MKVTITENEKTEIFVTLFHHIKTKISLINLHFNKDRLYMQGMDDAHVGLLELTLDNSWFKTYEIEEPVVLGINCEIFHKMLNCIKKDHSIIISCDNDGDHLLLNLESDTDELNFAFELPLVDIDAAILRVPDVEYTADITLCSKKLEELINNLVLFATTLNIRASEESIDLETTASSSLTQGVMKTTILMDQMEEYCIEEGETINLNFSLNYLKWMVEFSKLSENVSMHISTEYPLKLKYDLHDNSKLLVFVAPQMDEY